MSATSSRRSVSCEALTTVAMTKPPRPRWPGPVAAPQPVPNSACSWLALPIRGETTCRPSVASADSVTTVLGIVSVASSESTQRWSVGGVLSWCIEEELARCGQAARGATRRQASDKDIKELVREVYESTLLSGVNPSRPEITFSSSSSLIHHHSLTSLWVGVISLSGFSSAYYA